jgi:hypothetical protein
LVSGRLAVILGLRCVHQCTIMSSVALRVACASSRTRSLLVRICLLLVVTVTITSHILQDSFRIFTRMSQTAQMDTFLMALYRTIKKVSNSKTMPLWLRWLGYVINITYANSLYYKYVFGRCRLYLYAFLLAISLGVSSTLNTENKDVAMCTIPVRV